MRKICKILIVLAILLVPTIKGYAITLGEYEEKLAKYKDFKVTGTWSWAVKDEKKQEPDKTMVRAKIKCSFSRPGMTPLEREKAFLIVRP